jgi:hypothetical protein
VSREIRPDPASLRASRESMEISAARAAVRDQHRPVLGDAEIVALFERGASDQEYELRARMTTLVARAIGVEQSAALNARHAAEFDRMFAAGERFADTAAAHEASRLGRELMALRPQASATPRASIVDDFQGRYEEYRPGDLHALRASGAAGEQRYQAMRTDWQDRGSPAIPRGRVRGDAA